ncbi:unnamed protein product [Rotaria sp. Silwood1]|nr:unnamed protein product [Rotaria sp. Silwood1]CAF1399993.1 unnamed protein product [Rotaria sp. Silwood1]CAF3630548.1 unnamed protein product [Rotaria sp. Silwood1]CAF3665380.1 unnamed protein product [Rotaria sp. Silwood1]CAF3668084.1 unnamed protein product [Rotaria sp. Silwood1]
MLRLLFTYLLLILISNIICDEPPCPTLDDFLIRSPYLAQFNPYLYEGIWYELAFYDYTQFSKACGCTHLNWKLSKTNISIYSDDFITSCPYEPIWLRKNYTVHMNGIVNDKYYPFFIPEIGFHIQFNNTVVYYRNNEINNNNFYDRAIQYQCKVDHLNKRIFTGINFLSRTYFNSDIERQQVINEMINSAVNAGVEQKYLQELKIVQWKNC